MKLAEKFAKESTISLLGVIFGNINRYLFTIIIARWAGVQMLGIYSLANSILLIAESIAKMGLERGILRHVSMLESQRFGDFLLYDLGNTLARHLLDDRHQQEIADVCDLM